LNVQGSLAVARILPASAFLFSGVVFREIVMDLNDATGDAAAGIATLPVVLGPQPALAVATACAGAGLAGSCLAAVRAPAGMLVAAKLHLAPGEAAMGLVACMLLLTSGIFRSAWRIWRSDFEPTVVGQAVSSSFKPIGLGVVAFAALAALR
jgi:4-hydroxybenzoate polyprenyltransferase